MVYTIICSKVNTLCDLLVLFTFTNVMDTCVWWILFFFFFFLWSSHVMLCLPFSIKKVAKLYIPVYIFSGLCCCEKCPSYKQERKGLNMRTRTRDSTTLSSATRKPLAHIEMIFLLLFIPTPFHGCKQNNKKEKFFSL